MSEDIIKNKKAWLRRYLNNRSKIDRLKTKVSLLNQKLSSPRSPNMSGMPRGSTPITEADLIADKIDLESRIQRLEKIGKEYRREIINVIDDMSDYKYSAILEAWFINGDNPDTIAENEGYTVRHIFRLYAEAVERIDIPGLNAENDNG